MNRTILLSLLMIVIIVLSLTAECRARGCNYSFGNKRVAARKCKKHKRTKARFNDDLSSLQVERNLDNKGRLYDLWKLYETEAKKEE